MHGKEDPIRVHGGYRDLKSFQMSEIVYDATVKFCERFVDRFSRTTDQMVQAARSGRQHIAICLIHQTNYLLDQQLKALESDFLEKGGFPIRAPVRCPKSEIRAGVLYGVDVLPLVPHNAGAKKPTKKGHPHDQR